MENFRIVTDSCSDMDYKLSQQYNIDVVSLKYSSDEFFFDDPVGIERETKLNEFYDKIKKNQRFKTSQINPEEFLDIFRSYLKNGTDLLFILCSSGLSGTYNSAKIAAKEILESYPERRIIVIDSGCASLGLGLLVIEAAKKRDENYSMEEIAEYIDNIKTKVNHLAILSDLNYLKSGGRISPTVAFFGNILGMKPIVSVDKKDGRLYLHSKQRGMNRALNFLIEELKKEDFKGKPQTIYLTYNKEGTEKDVENGLKWEFNVPIIKSKLSATISSHTGLGTVAIFYKKLSI
ncbi:MAG: DegV family protein [Candidatus Improbicoccus pseudotrichonymphae]|uniref:DegV family protein n=1 Tax=Candidatus Improbicoccus pseudotrichonymphae TaxID=3033792 RepID=A0AA48KWY6_9FIRM|nr:MAG: DegV family protein [Candidatus Improbicoccus pseudotrichonymphae]